MAMAEEIARQATEIVSLKGNASSQAEEIVSLKGDASLQADEIVSLKGTALLQAGESERQAAEIMTLKKSAGEQKYAADESTGIVIASDAFCAVSESTQRRMNEHCTPLVPLFPMRTCLRAWGGVL